MNTALAVVLFVVLSLGSAPFSGRALSFLPTLPNGIASGDTMQTSTVLWAHSTIVGDLTFGYSTNANLENAMRLVTTNVVDSSVPVKVEITGLTPGTRYFYQVTDASSNSLIGSFRTPPAVGEYHGLNFGVSGDWRGELTPYQSIANAAEQNLDFFVELGDTAYVDVPSPAVPSEQARTLDEFRAKQNEVYSERLGLNALADLRSSTSILAIIDDHEVVNNFAGGAPPSSNPHFDQTGDFINETVLYRNGIQAFQEFNPVYQFTYNTPGESLTHNKPNLYRFRTYGSDAAIFLLDTRSFRNAPLAEVTNPLDGAQIAAFTRLSFDMDPVTGAPLSHRTLLGLPQLENLKADLLAAHTNHITWKFVLVPEPIQNLGFADAPDRFEGYAAERTELLKFIKENQMKNVVFISADIHGTIVNNVNYQSGPSQPDVPTGAFEIITGPVAYYKPFGPTAFDLAETFQLFPGVTGLDFLLSAVGLTNRSQFEKLSRQGKDDTFKAILDAQLSALGYDASGLEGSGINATLLKGGYVAVHTYGWTGFQIDQTSQTLTLTTYGIEAYSPSEVNPSILQRSPEIVSQFRVLPVMETGPIPALEASRSGSDILISWPKWATQFGLEATESLVSPVSWSAAPEAPSSVGEQNRVRLQSASGTRFYRLRKL